MTTTDVTTMVMNVTIAATTATARMVAGMAAESLTIGSKHGGRSNMHNFQEFSFIAGSNSQPCTYYYRGDSVCVTCKHRIYFLQLHFVTKSVFNVHM